jgi:hypothetical protein
VRGNHRATQPHAPAALIFDKVPVLNAQTLFAEFGRRRIEKDAACPALQHLQFMLIGASFPQSSYSCKKVPKTRKPIFIAYGREFLRFQRKTSLLKLETIRQVRAPNSNFRLVAARCQNKGPDCYLAVERCSRR